MTAQTLNTAPLARFALADENARRDVAHDPDGLAALARSIVAFGGLLDPLKVYADGDVLRVWDGGRRLAALQSLADDPAAAELLERIAYAETARDDAGLASMATFLREPMHPADRFAAYSALFDAGQTAEQIAAACAVSPRGVAQLLRFRVLAPEVLAAFKAGGMDFDACLAFTVSDDHDRQREVLASFGDRQPSEWQVRAAFKSEAVRADHPYVAVVGREAYAAAGGRFLLDLFQRGDGEETWIDGDLTVRLFNERRDAIIADVEAEGWGEVIYTDDRYGWDTGFDALPAADDDDVAAPSAEGVAFVILTRDGFTVERGYARRGKVKTGAAPKAGQTDPARWGWGHAGHEALTTQVTVATRAALIADPTAAYDALVATVGWRLLGWGGERIAGLDVAGRAVTDAEREALDTWRGRLPCDDRLAFHEAAGALAADDKAALLAFAFALGFGGAELRTDGHRAERWAAWGWIARRAGVTPEAASPVNEGWTAKGSRAALLSAAKDMGLPADAPSFVKMKVRTLAAMIAAKATETGWVPQLVRDLLTAPEPAKAAKRAKRTRRAANDEAADDLSAAA